MPVAGAWLWGSGGASGAVLCEREGRGDGQHKCEAESGRGKSGGGKYQRPRQRFSSTLNYRRI